jgi:hypothetical protein
MAKGNRPKKINVLGTFVFVAIVYSARQSSKGIRTVDDAFQVSVERNEATSRIGKEGTFNNVSLSERDSTTFTSSVVSSPFPRWGRSLGKDGQQLEDMGIPLGPIIDFLHGVASKTATTVRKRKPRARFPETLYVVDSQGLWTSRLVRDRTWNVMVESRLIPTEKIAKLAVSIILSSSNNRKSATTKWANIHRAIESGSGFPYLSWYGDYKSCNYQNWNGNSIPLFTV